MPVKLTSEQTQRVVYLGNKTKDQYPRAFSKCHAADDPENMDFIILYARAAAVDPFLLSTHKTGMNGKRGNANDPSLDVLAFKHIETAVDDRDVSAADVVARAGAPDAYIYFNDITDPSGAGAIYLDPFKWDTKFPYEEPQPPEPPQPTHSCALGASLFWALGGIRNNWPELDLQLQQLHAASVDYVRIFVHLNSDDPNNPWRFIGASVNDPDLEDQIRRCDDKCRNFGVKIGWTFTGGITGIETEDKQNQLVDRICSALADRLDNVYYGEMANEYIVNGLTTHILRHMARRTRQHLPSLGRLSLSSPNTVHNGGDIPAEVEKMYSGCPEANAITPHWDRYINQPPDLGPYAPSIVICNEPRGPMSSVAQTDDPNAIVGDYKAAADAGYDSYVLHGDSLIWSKYISPEPYNNHGYWPVFTDHTNGQAILDAVKNFRLSGTAPGPTPPGPTPPGPSPGDEDKLMPGEVLVVGQAMVSPNRTASVNNQVDGNMTIHLNGQPIWDLWQMELGLGENVPLTDAPGNFKQQEDGNAVLSDAHGNPLWALGTAGNPGAMMQVNDDGYWVMYVNGQPIWRRPQ